MDNGKECTSEIGDGLKFFEDENEGLMEVQNQMEVPLVSHDVPANQLSSPADSIPELYENYESKPHLKRLPNRVTRGKPKVNHEPVINSKYKYPINNYVSYHRLSKESMAFLNQLFIVSIPNNVQEALKDPRWREAMNEERRPFKRTQRGKLLTYLKRRYLLDVGGSSPLNIKLMELLNGAKQDLSPRDILKHMKLIIWRHTHQWPKLILFISYYLWR